MQTDGQHRPPGQIKIEEQKGEQKKKRMENINIMLVMIR